MFLYIANSRYCRSNDVDIYRVLKVRSCILFIYSCESYKISSYIPGFDHCVFNQLSMYA